ncbi:histamine H2 receptor-like [Dendronephthya gigantea]|uniref:histamine H2 receptor-like n=1 Tax=Dendronephthya gigantea TaxID=151771 RepID=UPI00106A8128|nr:histamine H2 receptor-like [Dendronephthya gigantea]XP_028391115.1 histamine H2 receptor-like [Dendronephthya gigantea]XP_028391116.1 histamine H2 receptor-like [Dendronephthya gigantea]
MNTTAMNLSTPSGYDTMNNPDGFTTGGIMKAFSLAILIFASIIGNLVVSVSFMMFRNLRSMTNYFLVSLSVSDILVAILVIPFYLVYQLYQPRQFFTPDRMALLNFWKIMDFFLCLTSVCTLTAISVERNLAISQPFYYTKLISPIRVYVTIAFLWMFAMTVSVTTRLDPFGEKSNLSVFIVVTGYILPLMIILVMYAQIWLVARRQARRLRQDGALATDFKAIKTIAIVIGTFFLCYTPNMVLVIWFHFSLKPAPSPYFVTTGKWLIYLNSCVNPIIYSCFNKTYRRGFKRLFQTILAKLRELRTRAGDERARKMRQSRLSLNITMRSSAGSLLDGSKLVTASCHQRDSLQSRASTQSFSLNAANSVDVCNNEHIAIKTFTNGVGHASEPVRPAESAVENTRQ